MAETEKKSRSLLLVGASLQIPSHSVEVLRDLKMLEDQGKARLIDKIAEQIAEHIPIHQVENKDGSVIFAGEFHILTPKGRGDIMDYFRDILHSGTEGEKFAALQMYKLLFG